MGFLFSSEFSQRWANTSGLIRQAISTELSDIIRLLQPETDPSDFRFTHPDLVAYINRLEADLNKQSQTVQPVSQSVSPSLPSTQRQVHKTPSQSCDKKYSAIIAYDDAFAQELDSLNIDELDISVNEIDNGSSKVADIDNACDIFQTEVSLDLDIPNGLLNSAELDSIDDNAVVGSPLNQSGVKNLQEDSAPESNLNILKEETVSSESMPTKSIDNDIDISLIVQDLSQHETMITGLEMKIEDHLADNMARMSEDLKAWLRGEVKRQLANSQ